jgi:hypothetical protein
MMEISMKSLQENMVEFRNQLEKGAIQKAYLGLMEYMMSLKNHFSNKYPDYSTPGSLYGGYMDMTYFSILPKSLKDRDLKIAIVFLYDTFRFEIWLSGKNKQVLAKYWEIISKSKWNKYKERALIVVSATSSNGTRINADEGARISVNPHESVSKS